MHICIQGACVLGGGGGLRWGSFATGLCLACSRDKERRVLSMSCPSTHECSMAPCRAVPCRAMPCRALPRPSPLWPFSSLGLLQVCQGLSHLHSAGFRHGDVKPLNVLIVRPSSPSMLPSPGCLQPSSGLRRPLGTAAAAGGSFGGNCGAEAAELGVATCGRYGHSCARRASGQGRVSYGHRAAAR